jgi:hypothetical protein
MGMSGGLGTALWGYQSFRARYRGKIFFPESPGAGGCGRDAVRGIVKLLGCGGMGSR